jgi:signal transduction histidine kinase
MYIKDKLRFLGFSHHDLKSIILSIKITKKNFMAHPWALFGLILMYASLTGITYAEISSDQNDTSQSGCIFGYDILNTTNNSLPLKEKISDMTTFVKKGITYAKNNSKESTLAAFNDIKGDFVKGEQYLFAYDTNGTTLALPYQQEIIGTNRMDLVDSNGMAFIKALTYLAGYGGGYLYYVYPNPAKNLTPQVKFAYVEPVDDTWFVGSGIYLPNIDAFQDKKAISGLVDRVNRSAAFAEKAGKEKASA